MKISNKSHSQFTSFESTPKIVPYLIETTLKPATKDPTGKPPPQPITTTKWTVTTT
jgi:hypothetical protein